MPDRPTARPTAPICSARCHSALSDVPVDRVAGAFLITDGRVHDIPANAGALGFQAPVHALITGHKDERDRRIAISAAPRFGIVGQTQTVTYRLDDQGVTGQRAKVTIRRDGETISERTLQSGQTSSVDIDIKHAGPNIVEIEASPLDNELTLVNNRAVVAIDGVRDKLRVLLVSGEPHSGERTWRNILKSDPSVDLVHFHNSAPAGETGRHADQRAVADRVSDPRIVPAEDQ